MTGFTPKKRKNGGIIHGERELRRQKVLGIMSLVLYILDHLHEMDTIQIYTVL